MSKPEERPGCVVGGLLAVATFMGLLGLRHRTAAEANGGHVDPASVEAGHELQDLTPRQGAIALGALIVAVFLLVVVITVFEVLVVGPQGHYLPIAPVVAKQPNVQPPPAPRLETANGQVLEQLHAQEDKLLNNYTWIDQGAGTVRIPIDRAIELIAQRGLPVQAPPAGATPNALTRPESSSSGRTQEATVP